VALIKAKTTDEMRRALATVAAFLACEAFTRYCRNVCQRLYLVGRKDAAGRWDVLKVAAEGEPDYDAMEVFRPEPLPRNLTEQHLADMIRGWIGKESCIEMLV
jgi:hypothetical protein